MGATAAPSVCAANSPIIISGELWATKATTSPRFTPSEASPAASARRRRRQTVRRDARTVEMGGDRRRTKGVYAFDYGDTVGITPIVKMHTLGHDFMPRYPCRRAALSRGRAACLALAQRRRDRGGGLSTARLLRGGGHVLAHGGDHSRAGELACDQGGHRRGEEGGCGRKVSGDPLQPVRARALRSGRVRPVLRRQAGGLRLSARGGGAVDCEPAASGDVKPGGRYFFAAACFSRNSLIICSCVARGTGWYLANSMENSPLPWVAERRSVEYPNISESGTCALAIRYPSTVSVFWMIPRRWFSWPTTAPWNSSGACTSTFMIGSRMTGFAFSYASRKPIRAAVLKACSLESTAWERPSLITQRTFTTGKPISEPFLIASLNPLSQAGMNSRGMAPPTTSSTNS